MMAIKYSTNITDLCVVQTKGIFQILANSHSAIGLHGKDRKEDFLRRHYLGQMTMYCKTSVKFLALGHIADTVNRKFKKIYKQIKR